MTGKENRNTIDTERLKAQGIKSATKLKKVKSNK